MTITPELKPCPFCGGKLNKILPKENANGKVMYNIGCTNFCFTTNDDTVAKLKKKVNARAAQPSQNDLGYVVSDITNEVIPPEINNLSDKLIKITSTDKTGAVTGFDLISAAQTPTVERPNSDILVILGNYDDSVVMNCDMATEEEKKAIYDHVINSIKAKSDGEIK